MNSRLFGMSLSPIRRPWPRISADHVRIAVLQPRELLTEVAGDVADVLQQLWLGQLVERGKADRHRQRVAAVGRAVRAHGHAPCGFGGRKAGADREAAAQRLGDTHDVRRCVLRPLIGEQPAGAAKSALDLVVDQQHAVLVAQRAQAIELGRVQRPRAAFALHGLDDHGRRRRAHQPLRARRGRRTAPGRIRVDAARTPRGSSALPEALTAA